MTDEQNDWLKWFDDWKGICKKCGKSYKYISCFDKRLISSREISILCRCGWEIKYRMEQK